MTPYGQKGGEGPTRGKKAIKYAVTLPSGETVVKRVYYDRGSGDLIATGFMHNGKPTVVVWAGEPAWEGDFGRLSARKIMTGATMTKLTEISAKSPG
jgi:hypothetical protein